MQEKSDFSCGTVAAPGSYLYDISYGNNQKLLDIIAEENIPVPEGYYEYLGIENPVEKSRAAAEPGKVYIPIKLWIYRNNNGMGNINSFHAYQMINSLNTIFANNTNLVFYLLCDISFINNSNYANSGHAYFTEYTLNNKSPNVLNVHLVISSSEWGGKANFPWDGAWAYSCAVETSPYHQIFGTDVIGLSKVLAHEIGHTLGLLHTHHPGRKDDVLNFNKDCGDCYQEAVSRSKTQGLFCISTVGEKKCTVNGDFLCDTAADPLSLYLVDNLCNYFGGGTDNWGDSWNPNTYNIMSYSLSECQNYFSPMQIAKMIHYKNIMNPAYSTFNISGPDRLCAGATATYTVTSLPGVSEYQWTVPTSMTILSSPPYSNSILVQASHSTGGQISVLPDCGSKPAYFWVKDTGSVDVTGFDTGCPNETYTYSVPFISGATYYWNAYENAQIVSGQNTNTVQVKLLPGASNKSYIIATVGICGNIYGHKQILHGDPPPPAPQCFAPTGGEDNKILQIPVQDFILYPNPAENSVTVVVPGDSEYTLTIWDIQGKMLYSEVILNNIEHIINTSAYNSGVYFVSLTDNEEGKTLTKRLIIKK